MWIIFAVVPIIKALKTVGGEEDISLGGSRLLCLSFRDVCLRLCVYVCGSVYERERERVRACMFDVDGMKVGRLGNII